MIFISEEIIENLKVQLKDKEKKLKNQANELNHLTNEIIPELKKENKKLKTLKIELTEALENSTKKYFNQLEINADLSDSVAKKGAALQLSKVRIEEIEKLVEEIEKESVAEINAVEAKFNKFKETLGEGNGLNPEKLEEIENLKVKIAQLEDKFKLKDKELSEKSKEFNNIKKDYDKSEDIINRLKLDIDKLNNELKDKNDALKDTEGLRGQIAKLESKLKDTNYKLNDKIKEYDKLSTRVKSKDKSINSLKVKNHKLIEIIKSQSKRGFFERLTNKSVDISDLEEN